jgi:cytochrome P450
MRLYPPVWLLVRNPVAAGEVGGCYIPRGSIMLLLPYCTHRHPEFWKNPEVFEPERFAPEQSAARPRYAYLPFGCGPHQCVGNEFALIEAQLVTAMIAQAFRLEPAPNSAFEPDPIFTLRPRTGMWMAAREP